MQNIETIFAKRLKGLRDAMNLSQVAFAAALAEREGIELDPTAITRIERGQRGISLHEAHAIARVLGTTVEVMCETDPLADIRDLRRELAMAEDQLVSIEMAAEMANRAYAQMRAHVEDLRAALAERQAQIPDAASGQSGDRCPNVPPGLLDLLGDSPVPGAQGDLARSPVSYLTVTEAARALGKSKKDVEKLIETRELPSVRVGRSTRVPEAWVRDRAAAAREGAEITGKRDS